MISSVQKTPPSFLERLVYKPSFGPTCSITSKARLTSSAGPAITPSSKNQRLISSAQLSEIALITFLRTKQNRTGARGSPCCTPTALSITSSDQFRYEADPSMYLTHLYILGEWVATSKSTCSLLTRLKAFFRSILASTQLVGRLLRSMAARTE